MLSEGAADLSFGGPKPAAGVSVPTPPGPALYGASSCGSTHRCMNPGDFQAISMASTQTMLGGVRRFDIAAMTAGTMSDGAAGEVPMPMGPAAQFPSAQMGQGGEMHGAGMPGGPVGVQHGEGPSGGSAGGMQTGGQGQQPGADGALPSRGSQINLEAMIGSSLASAINSLDHQHPHDDVGPPQSYTHSISSSSTSSATSAGGSSGSSGSVSPDLPAGAPELSYEEGGQPNAFNLFRVLQQRQHESGSPISPPGCGPPQQAPRMSQSAPSPGAMLPPHQPQHHAPPPRPPHPYSSIPFPHAVAAAAAMSPSPPAPFAPVPGTDGASPPYQASSPSPRPQVVSSSAASGPGVAGVGVGAGGGRGALFESATGIELVQFLLETESRALILFNVEALPSELLLLACEKMGSMSYFRADFRATRGVAFVAYHDLRAAIRAYHTLGRELVAAMGPQPGEPRPVLVHYSIMLNAAQTPRDGILLIRDGSGSGQAPPVTEGDLQAVFSSYGQLKNIHKRMGMGFLVEYYDTQDAKLAAYELSATTPWGPVVVVEEAERPDKERQLGQQLLLTLHRWREEQRQASYAAALSSMGSLGTGGEAVDDAAAGTCSGGGAAACCCCYNTSPQGSPNNISPPQLMYLKAASYPGLTHTHGSSNGSTPTYVAYPAGSYAAAMPQSPYAHVLEGIPTQMDETGLCQSFKGMWVTGPHHMGTPSPKGPCTGRSPSNPHYVGSRRGGRGGLPVAMGGMGMGAAGCGTGDPEYQLDIDRVLKGLDKRTTIMIRNIPNKYTQALLLNEINLNHKGKYDFFYLPIDFKNKCNVGYAFINFIDYRSIVPFFKEFNGQRWKNFNSEKVCAISYARIQGKQSMISRFQNSSLMEKDGEYRPLLFHSNGMDRGKPEPFPMSSKHRSRSGNTPPSGISGLMFGLGLGLGL